MPGMNGADKQPIDDAMLDVLVIGAGPTGLACAIAAQRAGLQAALVDKGCLCNSLFHYPSNMTFFTTPELLEIGDIPFSSPNQKPTRNEALEYYRKVAEHYDLDVRAYQKVTAVKGADMDFSVHTEDSYGREYAYRTRKLILATGYYDLPNWMNIPGEELAKVKHYYHDPHPYFAQDVLVVGGRNSAAIAALDLWRHGARVTLAYRGPKMHRHVKYWILPDVENRIKHGEITAYFDTTVKRITPDGVVLETPEGEREIPIDFVFAMTGYHPDYEFLGRLGIRSGGDDMQPEYDLETLESNVPGIYLAGVIVAGARTNEIFIENGRFHGLQIAADLKAKLQAAAAEESGARV
jgi:thioredoxin reductase (NADPH)